jgi:hypothetical protein
MGLKLKTYQKMKKTTFLMIWLLVSTAVSAQVNHVENPAYEPKARIEFSSLTHDFGKISVNSDATCEFTFTNTGQVPLMLTNVRASCGCTVPEWPREPILPGEKGVIKVKYTTVTVPNVINKSIVVNSNADNKQVILNIKGEVVPRG